MARTNENLIFHLQESGVLRTKRIADAFRAVDRADFVPAEESAFAYEDMPIPIGYGATISQPFTVAFMLEKLAPKKGNVALDVGSGSGWTTALLAYLVGKEGSVYGVEIISELIEFGVANLMKKNIINATIKKAGKKLGCPKEGPFDRILVSAASQVLPKELIVQLKVGGRLIIPIGSSIFQIDKVGEDEVREEEYKGFSFVPLVM